jgi:nucleotide-binding universal stress UspA family protein
VEHDTVSAAGAPYQVIEDESARHDLIVIGRDTDFHADEEAELSETADRLIRDNPKPVLMAPRQAVDTSHVLVAMDGDLPTVRAAHMFALLGLAEGRDVTVACVSEDGDWAVRQIEPAMALLSLHGGDAKARPVKTGAHPADVILSEARALGAGMIVMGAFGNAGLRELLIGSTTRRLLRSAPQALFIHH